MQDSNSPATETGAEHRLPYLPPKFAVTPLNECIYGGAGSIEDFGPGNAEI